MELKVWVEGIQRIVCGVTVNTTCQDVVFALAHATGKVGRFTLIERWRNNERLLGPNENPLKLLLKWGEYSNDVQFILQRSDQPKNDNKIVQSVNNNTKNKLDDIEQQQQHQQQQQNKPAIVTTDFLPLDRTKDTRKSFGLTETKQPENIGIVKGIPQKQQTSSPSSMTTICHHISSPQKLKSIDLTSVTSPIDDSLSSSLQNDDITVKLKPNEFNMADVRNSLDRKTNSNSNNNDSKNSNNSSMNISNNSNNETLMDVINCNKIGLSTDLYKNAPPISANGALVPPPYRDPPPPRSSPLNHQQQQQQQQIQNSKKFDFKDNINMTSFYNLNEMGDVNENLIQNAQYKDLMQLIKFQREKISSQQADLTKYDAEIVYLENKERDQAQQLDAITREISKVDQLYRQGNEQLQTLQYVEEENELVKQQEKTLKSEITLLRSKLANCETELLQCKNKIRLLMDDIQLEQRALNNRQKDNRQQMERNFLTEVERIQMEIDQAIQSAEQSSKTAENLKKEVTIIENAIAEKKRQVEQLVNEMKEVNLQSLTVTTSEEIKHLLEGSNRPGSTRRILGSPRQLENAVPTSKNPHGVWV